MKPIYTLRQEEADRPFFCRIRLLVSLLFVIIMTTAAAANTFEDDVDCSNLPTWDASTVYHGGDQVKYNGYMYQANYWTQNNNPEEYSDPYEHWTNLGPCDGTGGTNQPPSVSITSPANGAAFSSGDNVVIQANASDTDGSVVKVEFYSGTSKLGEDTSAPYGFTITGVAAGNYTLSAKAYDNDAAAATSGTVTITVNPPDGEGDCSGLPQYVAGTSYTQDQQVSNVDQKFRCDVPGWCSSTAAWAYEPGVGMYWQDAWTYVGDCGTGGGNQPPVVSISSPANGSTYLQGSNITITASASDSDGTVTKVEFFINGSKLGEDTSSPYSMAWNSVAAGSYTITAKATDNESATATSGAVSVTVNTDGGGGGDLPKRILVGYWHNFDNGSGIVKLRNVSDKWDVINIAFAEPTTPGGSTMTFTPDPAIYPTTQEFKDDVALLKSRGKKVLISIGGANGAIDVSNATAAQNFSSSMINIINSYGFSGMDIDLEGSSLSLAAGDNDFRNPVSAKVNYFISGTQTVLSNFGADFILSMAPETAFVQGGYSTYAGIYGAYLPVIYALRDQLDYIHVQHYNSGCMLGLDGRCYSQGTADFHVAMAEMLLQGFPVVGNPVSFPALRPDQVAIGLPASPSAAGGGYTTPDNVHKALDYLIKGTPFGGSYTLRNPSGYFDFRGLMTWSINWDIANGYEFSNSHRAYLDALDGAPMARIASSEEENITPLQKIGGYPNPFTGAAMIRFELKKDSYTSLVIYNNIGKKVAVLLDGELQSGYHAIEWKAENVPTGIYFFNLTAEGSTTTYKLYKK